MDSPLALAADPSAWLALATLIAMEIVLGVDNLVFVAILSSRLPHAQAAKARRIGIGLSLIFRVLLVAGAAYVVHLTAPLFAVLGKDFSWRDLILIAGGLFLVFKATSEIHHTVDPDEKTDAEPPKARAFAATVGQIVLLDLVFSIDSIITAVGMHRRCIRRNRYDAFARAIASGNRRKLRFSERRERIGRGTLPHRAPPSILTPSIRARPRAAATCEMFSR